MCSDVLVLDMVKVVDSFQVELGSIIYVSIPAYIVYHYIILPDRLS